MARPITINGQSVAFGDDSDVNGTNYVVLRTTGKPLDRHQKAELANLDIKLQEFVGNDVDQVYLCGFQPPSLAEVRKLNFVQDIGPYNPRWAVPSDVRVEAQGGTAVKLNIGLHHDVEARNMDSLAQRVATAANVSTDSVKIIEGGGLQVEVDAASLDNIAHIDEVRVLNVAREPQLFNNKARIILGIDNNYNARENMYTGENQVVCVADSGLDTGHISTIHSAFHARVLKMFPWGRKGKSDDPDGHGTHVSGSVLGNGHHKTEGPVVGTAPDAKLIMQSLFSKFETVNGQPEPRLATPATLDSLFQQAYDEGARIHTNSWGTGPTKTGEQVPYDSQQAASIDRFTWQHQDMTVLFSAGNAGRDREGRGTIDLRSLGGQASAKNCITVGASENNRPDQTSRFLVPYTYGKVIPNLGNPLRDDHMSNNQEGLAAFSSRGPTHERRLKPDVVAPGTAVLSARSVHMKHRERASIYGDSGDDKYMYLAGTSMATPLVAGVCAVLREALQAQGYSDVGPDGVVNPTGSLIKALLINNAIPIRGQYSPREVVDDPNPHSGFGRVHADRSVDAVEEGSAEEGAIAGYGTGAIVDDDTHNVFETSVDVAINTTVDFKVTLVYADQSGAELQNDLNLVVTTQQVEYHGNQSGQRFAINADEGFDRKNNVEQVVCQVPGGTTVVKITVRSYRFGVGVVRVPFAYAWRLEW